MFITRIHIDTRIYKIIHLLYKSFMYSRHTNFYKVLLTSWTTFLMFDLKDDSSSQIVIVNYI